MGDAGEAKQRQYLWYFRMYGDRVAEVQEQIPTQDTNVVSDGGDMLMVRVVAPDYESAKLDAADRFGHLSRTRRNQLDE